MDRIAALEAYTRIVELGSFTAASEDLRLRQATVSRWIAALEDELHVQLLDRTTRAVRVTEAGQRFYQQARGVLAAWSGAVAEAREEHEEVSGRLRVSVPVVFGQRFVSPSISGLMARYPALSLELSFSDRYVDLVEEGVDLAVRVGRPINTEYRARTLGETPRRLVASQGYLDAHGVPEHPDALAKHMCLLHSGINNRVSWSLMRDGREVRVDVRGRFYANHSGTLLEMACAGQGIALLASWLADDAIHAGDLVPLLQGYQPPMAPIQVLFSSTRHIPRGVKAMIDFLEEVLAPIFSFEERF